jgi:hypothetical protein
MSEHRIERAERAVAQHLGVRCVRHRTAATAFARRGTGRRYRHLTENDQAIR